MNEVVIAVVVSAFLGTMVILALWAALWKKRKKKHSKSESEESLNNEIKIKEDPALETKILSVQPSYNSHLSEPFDQDVKDKTQESNETEGSNGFLYFSLKYDENRSTLAVKLVKGENIPSQNPNTGKPSVEIQVLPARATPGSGRNGIEFEISKEELVRQTIHFSICRYDRYSRRSPIGDVFLSLAELMAEGVDLSHETFVRNAIDPNIEVNLTQPRGPEYLWEKIREAVREGKLQEKDKRRSFIESVTWDTESAEKRTGEPTMKEQEMSDAKREKEASLKERKKSVKEDEPLGNLLFSLKYDAKSSTLLVRIMRAQDIPDHNGEPPNVLVECALIPKNASEKPSATAVQKRTFTPVFEELFEYKIDFEDLWKKKLHLVVWYIDSYFHLRGLGEVIYSLSQLDIEGLDISQTAMLFSKEIVSLHQTKDSSLTDSQKDSSSILFSLTYLPATNRLGVFILKAKDLKTTHENNGVYVEVAVLHHNSRHRKVTSFKTETRNPVFNETLLFDLKDYVINAAKLKVTVCQKSTIGGDIPLGKTLLGKNVGGSEESHWTETLTAAKPIAQWHLLQPCIQETRVKGIPAVKTRELRSFKFSNLQ